MNRILIVDDKEDNLYYLRTVLTGDGCAVETACHGAEALVKARQNPPDLVISDLLMPVMDGYTLLRHWKADARLKKAPFIVYTATYTEEEDEQLALSLGADAFILKPAEPEDFLVRLRKVQATATATVPTPPKYPVGDEKALLQVYSETLIRKLEEKTLQLEEANRALQRDIAERKKLEQQVLRIQRMESIGALAGGIAHDLNNVLGPIVMSLDLLSMKFTDRASQDLISMIRASAQRGAAMVNQVLSFARGVEGKRVELQLKHVIREVEQIANDTFLKHIQVRTIIADDLWTILGDPTQAHQVLLNLCVNARDAMPNGGTLTISAENLTIDAQYAGVTLEARPGPFVLLQVEDSGTGMPPEIIEKIFDPFFTTKAVGKGTGLGLSTTLGIVKSHGGFIRVYSELGKGTTFRVYLPAQPSGSANAAAEITTEFPRGNGELILVIDDEATVREITRQTLEAFGYRAVLASDGAEALAVFARDGAQIAVVLTDITMPSMDGRTTIPILRRMNSEVPIIAASGLAANAQIAQLAGLGVKHFLSKPYTAETLLKTLRQALTEKP